MMTDFTAYAVGPCSASVCTSLDDEEAAKRLNREHPTGIKNQWRLSKDKFFADGLPMPCTCPDHPETHRHLLFRC